MPPSNFDRVETIYHDALDRPLPDRAAFLDEACGGDRSMRDAVARLLAQATADDFLDDSSIDARVTDGAGAKAGDRLGAYRLVEPIARGGMGEVWRAVREDEFEREVAVKLIRRGVDTDDVIARFRAERQVLAGLRHPNIATLLDGGAAPDGRPYLVLEYVRGLPIDEYCAQQALGVRERLELFLRVCEAVESAHRNLVIHRDVKPSNVLVTEDGEPKLLDFGIAKVLDADGLDRAATITQERRFTPAYASPEQARGEALTTSTDVYSLGVLLYELLTDARPLDLTDVPPADFTRVICEREPRLPSEIALPAGATEPATRRRRRRLEGDLDRIVLKALRKEPERRYASVERFTDDVRAHLDGRPVSAQPDTFAYRASRFLRRNRLAVVAGLLVGGTLLAAAAVSSVFAVRAAREQALAERQTAIAAAVSEFLSEGVLAQADLLNEASDPDLTVREALDRASERLADRFEDEPLVRAAIEMTLGRSYLSLTMFEEALEHYRAAFELRAAELGRDNEATLEAMAGTTSMLIYLGRYEEVEPQLREQIERQERVLGPDHELTLSSLNAIGLLYDNLGRDDEALAAMNTALDRQIDVFGVEDVNTLISMNNLGLMYVEANRHAEGEPFLRRVYEVRLAEFGADHPDTLVSVQCMAWLHEEMGELDKALALLEKNVADTLASVGPDHLYVSTAHSLLGSVQRKTGDLTAAEYSMREAVRIRHMRIGADHVLTQQSESILAWVLRDLKQYDEAELLFVRITDARLEQPGRDSFDYANAINSLGELRYRSGRYAEAHPDLIEAVEVARDVLPEGDHRLGLMLINLGAVELALGMEAEGRVTLEEALELIVGRLGEEDERVERVRDLLAGKPDV